MVRKLPRRFVHAEKSGNLALSRAIGDFEFKKSENLTTRGSDCYCISGCDSYSRHILKMMSFSSLRVMEYGTA